MSERLADVQKGRNAKDIGMMGESKDPTQAAMMHGNQPSKGAKIDKELMEEDEKYLKQKGKA